LGSRTLNFQFRPEFAQPPEVGRDVRVRQAIAYAIDKQESFDVVTGGHGLQSNTRSHPGEEYQPLVDREVTKYSYDPRKAVQLLQDAGFSQTANGQWLRPAGGGGGPVQLPISYTGGSKLFEHENFIIVDQLRRFGIDASSKLFPSSGTPQDRAQLPGMDSVGSADPTQYRTVNTPTADNRWSGANRGGYANPELDRLADALDKAIVPSEIVQATIQLEKLTSSDLPGIFLYYHSRAWNHVANLTGPTVRQSLSAGHPLRRIYQWEWTA
jgi:peptide/nickel transport system substrate-binding protein